MTDTIDEIRARHEAVELALQTTGLRSQEAHTDRATLLRLLSEERARRGEVEGALRLGKIVMDMLEEHGPSIVPHLLDTDENAGQRFRDVLARAALEQTP